MRPRAPVSPNDLRRSGSSIPRVLLIYPHLPASSYKLRLQDRESLALGYLSAALRRAGVDTIPRVAVAVDRTPEIEPRLMGETLKLKGSPSSSQARISDLKTSHPLHDRTPLGTTLEALP